MYTSSLFLKGDLVKMTGMFIESLKKFKSGLDNKISVYFDARIAEEESLELKETFENLKGYVLGGGKRLRPNIISRMNDDFKKFEGIDDILLAFEFLHNSTLIDDDIIDEHDKRRNMLTLRKVYGSDYNTLLNANLLRNLGSNLILNSELPDILKKEFALAYQDIGGSIDKAQILDLSYRGRLDISEKEYIAQSEMVTAKFIAYSFWLCAPNIYRKDFFEAGRNLGLAFQFSDDLMDIDMNKNKGRDIGSDIKEGTPTLLSIYTSQSLKGSDNEKFRELFGKKDLSNDELGLFIGMYGEAIGKTKDMVRAYVDKANLALCKVGLPNDHWIFDFGDYSLKRLD
jgi:geranylgeranyl diphosphate synthase type II